MDILLLEDDTMLAELIKEHLEEQGNAVDHFIDGEEAEDAILSKKYDLLLLDVNVPSINGFELLKSMRERKDMTPAIMITSRNSSIDVKEGFEYGCDDYIKKPFEFEELDARIEHIVRMFRIGENEVIKISDNILFYPALHKLEVLSEPIALTPKASEILHYLYKNRDRIVSREELTQNLWVYDEIPTDATIRSYIKTLRKYISNIITERGVGYGFKSI
ncbi:response regulator transcription factor [Hydrogenimonas thermophila]|uniref:DNA-binding response regulator, OmpR family, contains REC and winged-helix (WHTH) domain n=1 Tax=Hydrogenimonas thermophila TaxID=223786 RepID=A0A1I5TYI0_9BACT|nr:response regulator transcription factor [Hydrogenimonas thermophila]SFP87687.1 DNA-binding response regulator, OmpR family, contains REC and winged-helix (wHTH) domain [Hydrogenimonas thermophila]